ncbi:hypothetical protein KFU94_05790 [Chloroflexi bacterium TSY]|nr:hypothetical protein [Chloroflexi bacterium TSY]
MYTRLTAAEMRTQLIEQKGYTDEELPGEEAIRLKLNELGYGSNRVKKSQPGERSQRPMRSLIEFIRPKHRRGRKAEDHIPTLLADMVESADQFSQTDPTFRPHCTLD